MTDQGDQLDAARRLLFTFAQLTPKEMAFVHALLCGKAISDAAQEVSMRRNNGMRYLRSIVRRHPEFSALLPAGDTPAKPKTQKSR